MAKPAVNLRRKCDTNGGADLGFESHDRVEVNRAPPHGHALLTLS